MRSTRLALVGLAVIALGLIVGLAVPIHAEGVSCGTALRESRDADVADLVDTLAGNRLRTGAIGGVSAACDEARNVPRVISLVIIGAGGITALASLLYRANEVDERDREAGSAPTPGAAS